MGGARLRRLMRVHAFESARRTDTMVYTTAFAPTSLAAIPAGHARAISVVLFAPIADPHCNTRVAAKIGARRNVRTPGQVSLVLSEHALLHFEQKCLRKFVRCSVEILEGAPSGPDHSVISGGRRRRSLWHSNCTA